MVWGVFLPPFLHSRVPDHPTQENRRVVLILTTSLSQKEPANQIAHYFRYKHFYTISPYITKFTTPYRAHVPCLFTCLISKNIDFAYSPTKMVKWPENNAKPKLTVDRLVHNAIHYLHWRYHRWNTDVEESNHSFSRIKMVFWSLIGSWYARLVIYYLTWRLVVSYFLVIPILAMYIIIMCAFELIVTLSHKLKLG